MWSVWLGFFEIIFYLTIEKMEWEHVYPVCYFKETWQTNRVVLVYFLFVFNAKEGKSILVKYVFWLDKIDKSDKSVESDSTKKL